MRTGAATNGRRAGPTAATTVSQALRTLLESGDEVDRCQAARACGTLGLVDTVEALAARLGDSDPDVAVEAAAALGAIGDSAAVPALLGVLDGAPDADLAVAAVEALGRIGGPRAVPALLSLAEARPADLEVDPAGEWDPWWDMQLAAVRALGEARVEAAAPVLARVLDDEDGQDIEADVVAALARIDAAGERILVERLASGDARIRRRIAAALGRASSRESLAPLARAAVDAEPAVREAAVTALAERGARAYLRPVLALARDADPGVRAAAIAAAQRLAGSAPGSATESRALAERLPDPDPRVRRVVVTALGTRAAGLDEATFEALADRLDDADPEVAAAAAEAIAAAGRPGAAAGRLCRCLEDADRDVRVRTAAAAALARNGHWDEAVAGAFFAVLGDEAPPVRLRALEALMDLAAAVPAPGETGDVADPGADRLQHPLDLVLDALGGRAVAETEAAPGAGAVPDAEAGPARPDGEARATRTSATTEIPVEVAAPPAAATVEPPALPAVPSAGAAAGEVRPARSSLEAIAIDNAEAALAPGEAGDGAEATRGVDAAAAAAAADPGLAEFAEIVARNEAVGEWIFTRDRLPVARDVRRLAARVLARAPVRVAAPALAAALAGPEPFLHRDCADSLATLASRGGLGEAAGAALDALLASAAAPDRDVRVACLRALGAVADPRAEAAIAAALDDAEPAVRAAAVRALAALGACRALEPERALERVVACLEDPAPALRIAAAQGIATLAPALAGSEAAVRAADGLLAAARRDGGAQAAEMGRALAALELPDAVDRALAALSGAASGLERRPLVDLLEALCREAARTSAPSSSVRPEEAT